MTGKSAIVNGLLLAALAAAVVLAGVAGSRHAADPVCGAIQIIIEDSLERQYVSSSELQQQLQEAGLWQIGERLSKIHCQAIETHLLTHPMLRQAECYELHRGELRIVVSQRQPLMLVKGDEHYYLDTDRRIMPVRASVNTPVVVVTGRIGKQQAQGELYDFVAWLGRNKFWREKIHTIHVVTPKMIELEDDSRHYTLVLGTLDGAQKRLNSLQRLYEKGFDQLGYPPYKQIDLQYTNQIIGRK